MHIQRLEELKEHELATSACLANGASPGQRAKKVLRDLLGADWDVSDIKVARQARATIYDTVSVGDVVVFGDGVAPAIGQVELLMSVPDGAELHVFVVAHGRAVRW